jgi:DNA processing protein
VIDERTARLVLFSAISPGNIFWANQIASLGASQVYHKIIKESSYSRVSDYQEVKEKVAALRPLDLIAELRNLESDFISPIDLDWPISLMDLSSPPIGLVIKGNRGLLGGLDRSISIVGSRRPTEYGLAVSNKLAADSATAQVAVISGGAYGIDTAAHKGALGAGGSSVAVLAGGFNHLYPAENKKLFSQITSKGLLISEVMPNIKSEPSRFLIRNRLIAALSKATVVVEAEFVSGSIRTARDAAEIFRPVFAIPGQISSPLSAGCHRLIADRVADIATNLVEILEVITPLQKR